MQSTPSPRTHDPTLYRHGNPQSWVGLFFCRLFAFCRTPQPVSIRLSALGIYRGTLPINVTSLPIKNMEKAQEINAERQRVHDAYVELKSARLIRELEWKQLQDRRALQERHAEEMKKANSDEEVVRLKGKHEAEIQQLAKQQQLQNAS